MLDRDRLDQMPPALSLVPGVSSMDGARDIVFEGLSAPLRLIGAAGVLPLFRRIVAGWRWHCRPADPEARPFYTIRAVGDAPLLCCDCHVEERPQRWFDPVNAVCDAVSVLALALPAERPEVICLHAAAVAMAGRLVVFPNIRRAGKSTLSAALARAGHAVFSDDVLPVHWSDAGQAFGSAMGCAPRLRLPLPESAGQGFRNWVAGVAGPANAQYQYLALPDQPPHGAVLPLGAFVILDRQDGTVAARLERVSPDVAMDALLFQNFTRDRHSADILEAIGRTLAERPAYRLTYSDLDSAVACLEGAFAAWPDAAPEPAAGRTFRMAEPQAAAGQPPTLDRPLVQRAGCLSVTIGDKLYLSDPEGRAIHRTDPLAAAIWELLADPIPGAELLGLLAEGFPDTAPDQIAADLTRLLTRMHGNGLIA